MIGETPIPGTLSERRVPISNTHSRPRAVGREGTGTAGTRCIAATQDSPRQASPQHRPAGASRTGCPDARRPRVEVGALQSTTVARAAGEAPCRAFGPATSGSAGTSFRASPSKFVSSSCYHERRRCAKRRVPTTHPSLSPHWDGGGLADGTALATHMQHNGAF
jgi:hypothetical protein